MKLLLATGNKGKVREFQRILLPLGVTIVTPEEIGADPEVEETGATFIENARIKAEYLFTKTKIPTIADDSGLCIDALAGMPGVKTARFGGESTGYPERFQMLFDLLEERQNRDASFVCSICCILDEHKKVEVTQRCYGTIGTKATGTDGFGYDPIFYVGDKSFAQLTPEEKDKISHRGKALREFVALLEGALKGEKNDND